MPITANVTNDQITASVGETRIDVSVSGGVGPTGPAGAAGVSNWNDITGKPSTFTPSAHTHVAADLPAATEGTTLADAGIVSLMAGGGISRGSTPYIFLVEAGPTQIGGIKIGSGLSMSNGVCSVSVTPGDIGAAAASHAHSATDDLTFAGATAGQVLTVNSGATALVWATPATYTLPQATNSTLGGITVSTGLSVASGALSVSYGTSSGTACQGNDSRLHTRSHAITSTSDHTATAWRTFYSDSSGHVTELALGASGTVLTSGGASAAPSFAALPAGGTKTLARFTPEMNQPPSTAYATFDTRNSILVLEFDASTQESAVFCGVIPESSTFASGLIVRIWWMGDTATSGNVRWGVSFEKTGTDNDSDSFDTVTQAHSAANGTSGIETVTSITATAIDSLAAGDRFRLKVTRIADDATNDTMTGDAQLVAVEVQAA